VREILGLLHIVHNRRLLGMLDSFRRNAAVEIRTCVLPATAWLLATLNHQRETGGGHREHRTEGLHAGRSAGADGVDLKELSAHISRRLHREACRAGAHRMAGR
jgi:hypothetical protein